MNSSTTTIPVDFWDRLAWYREDKIWWPVLLDTFKPDDYVKTFPAEKVAFTLFMLHHRNGSPPMIHRVEFLHEKRHALVSDESKLQKDFSASLFEIVKEQKSELFRNQDEWKRYDEALEKIREMLASAEEGVNMEEEKSPEETTANKSSTSHKQREQAPEEDDYEQSFRNHDNDDVPMSQEDAGEVELDIRPNDTWEAVWDEMDSVGWSKRPHGRDFVYTKPGKASTDPSSVENVDYFLSTSAVHSYLWREYRWAAKDVATAEEEASEEEEGLEEEEDYDEETLCTPDRKTKPQDPGKPLLPSPESSAASEYSNEDDKYLQKILWPKLSRCGWKRVNAKNPLHDWYYVRPGHSKDGEPGEDYFVCWDDVVNHVKAADERDKAAARKAARSTRISMEPEDRGSFARASTGRSKVTKTKKSSRVAKFPIVTTSKKYPKRAAASTRQDDRHKRIKVDSGWWKSEDIPTFTRVLPLLEKVGYSMTDDGRVAFPASVCNQYEMDDDSKRGFYPKALGAFFCKYGIPLEDKVETTLTKKEMETLDRWIRFANVPVSRKGSAKVLRKVKFPKAEKEITALLTLQGGCQGAGDGNWYLPGTDNLHGARERRVHGVHYYKNEETEKLKAFFRGAWDLRKTRSYDEHQELRLRLWAATSSEPLPAFEETWPESWLIEGLFDEDYAKGRDTNKDDASTTSGMTFDEAVHEAAIERPPKKKVAMKHKHWWQRENVPSFKRAWPLLKKVGYTKMDDGCIAFPSLVIETFGSCDSVFRPETLRKFLCKEGIPFRDTVKAALGEEEFEILRRWIAFANVPVSSRNSASELQDIHAPKNDGQIHTMMIEQGHCQSAGDGFYYTHKSDDPEARSKGRKLGVHKLKKDDIDEIRKFMRAAWDLPPPKNPSREKLLQFRVWAANTSVELPDFMGWPSVEEMELLAILGKEDETESVASSSVSSEDDVSICSNENDVSVSSGEIPWYMTEALPSFSGDIMPILAKYCGVSYSTSRGEYTVTSLEQTFRSGQDLASFMLKNAIPGTHSLRSCTSPEEKQKIARWLAFTHVPHVSDVNSIAKLGRIQLCSRKKCMALLKELDFSMDRLPFRAPGADDVPESRWVEGQHKFNSIEAVRKYIRDNESLWCNGDAPRKYAKKEKAMDLEDRESLRFWAALSEAPLLQFDETVLVECPDVEMSPQSDKKRGREVEIVDMIHDDDGEEEESSPAKRPKMPGTQNEIHDNSLFTPRQESCSVAHSKSTDSKATYMTCPQVNSDTKREEDVYIEGHSVMQSELLSTQCEEPAVFSEGKNDTCDIDKENGPNEKTESADTDIDDEMSRISNAIIANCEESPLEPEKASTDYNFLLTQACHDDDSDGEDDDMSETADNLSGLPFLASHLRH